MLSKREEDALRGLEESLKSDETFSRNSTKLLTRIDKKEDKAIGLKRGLLCLTVGIGLLFAAVLLNIFALAVIAGLTVAAGVYLAMPWRRVGANLIARFSKTEQKLLAALEKKRAAKPKK